jgi:drug/metabolite transporter (DMT)-like permease
MWFGYAGHLVSLWRANRPGRQLPCGLFLFSATCCNVLTVRHPPLAETGAIHLAIPLPVAAFAVLVLGERIGPAALGHDWRGLSRRARRRSAELGGDRVATGPA